MRLRLTIADVLVFLAIAASGLAVATQLGYEQDRWPDGMGLTGLPRRLPPGLVEGLLTSIALTIGYLAWRVVIFRRWWRQMLLLLLAGMLLWFAAVDRSVHHAWCQHCGRIHTEVSIRIYRYPLWQFSPPDGNSVASDIATELGIPCQHEYTRYQFARLWGLVVHYPGIYPLLSLQYDEQRSMDELRPHLQAMVRDNPNLPAEFHREAIIAQNHDYLRQFMTDLNARMTATENSISETSSAR